MHHLGQPLGRGTGRSKKLAEGAAALNALESLQGKGNPPPGAMPEPAPTIPT